MKKRDLTKLALMGVAIGLCGGQIQADELCDGVMEEQLLAQAYPNRPVQGAPNQRINQQNAQPQGQVYPESQKGGKTGKGQLVQPGMQPPPDHPAGEQPQWNNNAAPQANNQKRNTNTADSTQDAYQTAGCGAKPMPAAAQNARPLNPNSTNR